MRLGQLARKYDIPVQEIITYLEDQTGEKFHPNAKLYEALESKVFDYFDLLPISEPKEETITSTEEYVDLDVAEESAKVAEEPEVIEDDPIPEEPQLPLTPEEEIAALDGDLASPEEIQAVNETANVEKDTEPTKDEPAEDEVIQTDKLLEMLESEDAPADLDKIKLIKAPKKELSGLKVVGKVDLPEPKKKEEKEKEESDIVTEKDLREYRNPRRKRREPLSEEEKEKRRLRAKRKKEEYEARQEKRRKEKEERVAKARKEQHYKQKLEQAKAVKVKRQAKHQIPETPKQKDDERPKPKTLLGKFWRWMNT